MRVISSRFSRRYAAINTAISVLPNTNRLKLSKIILPSDGGTLDCICGRDRLRCFEETHSEHTEELRQGA